MMDTQSEPAIRRGRPVKWTKDHCLHALQQFEQHCTENGKLPTITYYTEYCSKVQNIPSVQSVILLFPSWNEARRYASENDTLTSLNSPGRHRVWAEELCLEAIRRYEEHCREIGQRTASRDGYQAWHRENPGTPSIGPIEQMGSWNTMRLLAARESHERSPIVLHQRNWPQEECIEILRQYIAYCQQWNQPCTRKNYDDWRTSHSDAPSSSTIINRGNWKTMIRRAEESTPHLFAI